MNTVQPKLWQTLLCFAIAGLIGATLPYPGLPTVPEMIHQVAKPAL